DARQVGNRQEGSAVRLHELPFRDRPFYDRASQWGSDRDARVQIAGWIHLVNVQTKDTVRLLRTGNPSFRLGEIAFRLLQGNAGSRLMLEEVFCHCMGFVVE